MAGRSLSIETVVIAWFLSITLFFKKESCLRGKPRHLSAHHQEHALYFLALPAAFEWPHSTLSTVWFGPLASHCLFLPSSKWPPSVVPAPRLRGHIPVFHHLLYESAGAVMTECHRLGGLNRNLFPTLLKAGSPDEGVGRIPLRPLSSACRWPPLTVFVAFHWCTPLVSSSSYVDRVLLD